MPGRSRLRIMPLLFWERAQDGYIASIDSGYNNNNER